MLSTFYSSTSAYIFLPLFIHHQIYFSHLFLFLFLFFFFLMIRPPPRSTLLPYPTVFFFFFNDTAPTEIYPFPLPDALPISYVKTSLVPGSKVVTEYLREAGLLAPLAELGFDLVGYGCTTCIGNSGPLSEPVAKAVKRSEEHTSELQSRLHLVCRLLLEKKKK